MSIGIVGRKCGMSRIFTENGESVPVTLIEATPNRIVQIKTQDADGYQAVQVTAGEKRAALVTKPLAGHYAKAKVEAGRGLWEFRVDALDGYEIGGEIRADIFSVGQVVDVQGTTKGGHMGAETQTTQNLQVMKVDAERGLIAIRGAIPGAPGGNVIVRPAAKG